MVLNDRKKFYVFNFLTKNQPYWFDTIVYQCGILTFINGESDVTYYMYCNVQLPNTDI